MFNRREPLANEMVYYIQTKGKQIEKQGMKDNLYMAMENWLTLGIQAGFCISEWAQYRTRLNQANDFARSCDGSSTTFRTEDILSFLSGKKMINIKQSLLKLKHAKLVNLCWRFQKNLDNGQQLTYTSDKSPVLCFVKSAVEIRRRVLRAKLDILKPISVFLQHDKIPKNDKFIIDIHIKTLRI